MVFFLLQPISDNQFGEELFTLAHSFMAKEQSLGLSVCGGGNLWHDLEAETGPEPEVDYKPQVLVTFPPGRPASPRFHNMSKHNHRKTREMA